MAAKRRRESKQKFREKLFGELATRSTYMEKPSERADILEVLDTHPSEKIQDFVTHAWQPHNQNKSLARIARDLGITSIQIAEAYRDQKMQGGLVRMFKHIPDVMEDVAIDAKSTTKMCRTCMGIGVVVPEGIDTKAMSTMERNDYECKDCKGKGEVRVAGDADARKLVFEAAKLTGKSPLVAVQNNSFTGSESLEDLISLTRKVTTPAPKQIPEVTAEPAE